MERSNPIKQYGIYYIQRHDSNSDKGTPAIVITTDRHNAESEYVTVIYLRRYLNVRSNEEVVDIYSTGIYSFAIVDQPHTIHKQRVGSFLNMCSEAEINDIREKLEQLLSLKFQKIISTL